MIATLDPPHADRPPSPPALDLPTMVQMTPASGQLRSPRTIALVATLGSLLFGYDTGVISGALPYMAHPVAAGGLGLTAAQEGMIGGLLLVGAAFGALLGGRLSDRFGRRRMIVYLAVVFLFGALGTAFAPSMVVMYPFRFFLGLAVGGASTTVPVYLAETAPKKLRGTLVAIDQVMIVTGQLLAFAVNAIIANTVESSSAWRIMLFVCSLPAVALWLGMHKMPESARWQVVRQNYYAAIGTLRRIRPGSDEDLIAELQEIIEVNQADARSTKAGWRDLKVRWIRRIVFIGVGIAILQQTTGINTLMYYAPKILMATGQGERASITAQVANGVISVVGSVCGLWFIARLRRRRMLITGQAGIIVSLLLIAVIFMTQVQPHLLASGEVNPVNPPAAAASYAVLAAMMLFLFFNQGFQAPANWVLLSEIFPTSMRGFGMGLAVFCLWIVNAIITWVFPIMIENLGGGVTFLIFAGINVGTIIFSILCVPETKHLSLEELERHLKERYS
jgi:major inositol transporter-like SP family MFS transporter